VRAFARASLRWRRCRGRVGLLREANPILIIGLFAYLIFDVMVLWATFRAIGPRALGALAMGYLIGELGGLIPSCGIGA